MGAWLGLWVVIAVLAGAVVYARRDAVATWRAGSAVVVAAVAFGLVAVPRMKDPFYGTMLAAVVLLTATEMLMYVMRVASMRGARLLGGVVLAAFAGLGLVAFRFQWSYDPARTLTTATQRPFFRSRIDRIVQVIENDPRRPLDVFLTGPSNYLSADVLTYYLYKRPGHGAFSAEGDERGRLFNVWLARHARELHRATIDFQRYKHRGRAIVVIDLVTSDDIGWFATAIGAASYVIAPSPDYDALIPWLPSTRLQGRIRELIAADPSLRLLAAVKNELGHGSLNIYRRGTPFEGIGEERGLDPEEGPYPSLGLPAVRWGLRQGTDFTVILPASGATRLLVEAKTPIAGQILVVSLGGRRVHEHRFATPNEFERFEVTLAGSPGPHRVTLGYARWLDPIPEERRALAVLFRRLEAIPSAAP
jgi:hypothetical protein